MKYRVGDKVEIKTWDQMVKKFGIEQNLIMCDYRYLDVMEHDLRKISPDRIITIKKVCNQDDDCNFYDMEEIRWKWSDDMIKCLENDYTTFISIQSDIQFRFELMDFK